MNSLRNYLNSPSWAEQCAYAQRAGTTLNYLRKALSLGQKFGGVTARGLDEASGGAVSRHVLRPDIFGEGPDVPGRRVERAVKSPCPRSRELAPKPPRGLARAQEEEGAAMSTAGGYFFAGFLGDLIGGGGAGTSPLAAAPRMRDSSASSSGQRTGAAWGSGIVMGGREESGRTQGLTVDGDEF